MIRLITKKDGKIVLNKTAKAGVSVGEICEIAECEVYDGFADYACVEIDGEIYAEYES